MTDGPVQDRAADAASADEKKNEDRAANTQRFTGPYHQGPPEEICATTASGRAVFLSPTGFGGLEEKPRVALGAKECGHGFFERGNTFQNGVLGGHQRRADLDRSAAGADRAEHEQPALETAVDDLEGQVAVRIL